MTGSCPAVHGTGPGDLAVRPRAETNIVTKLPVVQVVSTAFVRHRKRRNLVVVETDNAVPVSLDDVTFEFFLNALRLKGGFSPELFEQRTGLAWQQLQPIITKAKADGLLEKNNEWVCTTTLGWRFLDDLLQRFLVTDKSS